MTYYRHRYLGPALPKGFLGVLATAVLTAIMPGVATADLSVSGDTIPLANTISDAGGDIGGDLTIGNTGVAGMFMDAAPPLFDPLQTLISENGYIGRLEGSIGAVSLEDFLGGDWEVTDSFFVGAAGEGFLDLTDSASVTVGNLMTVGEDETGAGLVTLTGQGTRIRTDALIVGDAGYGEINISSRAIFYSGSAGADSIIGNNDGGIGVVSLSGVGSRWNVGTTSDEADLIIGNGDSLINQASGKLSIANESQVLVSGFTQINFNGRLQLLNGGRLRSLTSTGPVNSILNNGVILGDGYVDFTAHTMINGLFGEIRNASGKVIPGTGIVPDVSTNQREKLVFTGGGLINNGLIESIGGEMEFYAPVDNTIDGDIIARDAILRFHEGLINDGQIGLGGDTTIYGDISLSNSLVLTSNTNVLIRGNVTFNSPAIAVLTIGDDPSFLDVIGNVDINGGFLSLSYDSGGTSSVLGDSYEIITATGGVTGSFQNAVAVADGFLWDIVYTPNSIIVTNNGGTPNPMGSDFNGDGIVDLLDLQIWKDNYGRTPPPANLQPFGDADGDGDIDGADFLEWQMHAGGPPLVAASTAVPEPSSLALLLGTVVCLSCRRQ